MKHEQLVPVSTVVRYLAGDHMREDNPKWKDVIAKYGISVVGRIPLGRGTAELMTQVQAASIKSQFPQGDYKDTPVKSVRPAEPVNVDTLQDEIKQLQLVVAGQTEAINILTKQANLVVERLNSVLNQLGATQS